MIESFENLFSQIEPMTAYIVLFVSAFTENVLPPVPGDTVVIFGAYLVSIGQLSFWGVYISTTLGSVVGFVTMYYIGIRVGRPFIYAKKRSKIFKEKNLQKVEIWFSKWGYWVIFANRFLSGTRSVISIFAGLFHLNVIIVVSLALLSALIWNALLISGGLLVGNNWDIITDIVSNYNKIFITLTIFIIIYLIYRKIKPSNKNTEQ